MHVYTWNAQCMLLVDQGGEGWGEVPAKLASLYDSARHMQHSHSRDILAQSCIESPQARIVRDVVVTFAAEPRVSQSVGPSEGLAAGV
jgi:hypothetical protein